MIDRLGLGDVVELAGQVSHAEVLSGLAAADILLSIQGPGYSGSIPAKLYEYLAFDKPILQLAEPGGDIDWALASSGVPHRVVSQSDEGAIREALLALVAALTDGAGPSGDPLRLRAFTREHLMGELAGHLDRALQVRSHVGVPA